MLLQDRIWMATGDEPCYLLLNQANRHGIISGASGTGKTVTLKVMAEAFSQAGVPVFMADVKGDVTGMCQAGDDTENIQKRVVKFGIENWVLQGCPCRFWDMLGDEGIPVRVTVSDMGPTLLSRLLGLSDAQEGVLNAVFRIADDNHMLLIDLKDLRSMLNYVGTHAKEYELIYGRIAQQSVSAILRELLAIEDQGGTLFFGEPALDLNDWFACAPNGHGYVNILNSAKLIQQPAIYSMFLLWMLSTLFDVLPEVGDLDKPKFVFFFDEAHLLFNDMPKSLVDKIVQVVKLIRSKGVGVYFITQSPNDIPDEVLAQLSNRVQHGLRAYTPAEQKTVRAAAQAFRENPKFNSEDAILELGTGEALVSFLDEEGRPSIVQNAKILPPQCLMAQASPEAMKVQLDAQSNLVYKYGDAIDRESAYELILEENAQAEEQKRLDAERAAFEKEKAEFEKQKAKEEAAAAKEAERLRKKEEAEIAKEAERLRREEERERQRIEKEAERQRIAAEKKAQKEAEQFQRMMTSIATSAGRTATNKLVRGIMGNLFR